VAARKLNSCEISVADSLAVSLTEISWLSTGLSVAESEAVSETDSSIVELLLTTPEPPTHRPNKAK